MKLKILALGAGLTLAATAAVAAGAPAAREQVEDRIVIMSHGPDGPGGMDADKDGVVTRAEFNAMHDKMWARLDRNGNGRLDGDEAPGHGSGDRREIVIEHGPGGPGGHGAPGHPHAGHGPAGTGDRDVHIIRRGGPGGEGGLDADKDGRLSLDEFTAPLRDHFKEADKNRNGFLDKGEMEGDGERVFIRRVEKRED